MFHVESPKVIVVGGGHAGVEAALASARVGVSTLLITMSARGIGRMPCNPAVGGQAKGHLVREIDALGGQMALATDATTIQFKYLNTRKGLAVRSSRAQVDRFGYQRTMERTVRQQPGLSLLEGEVARVCQEGGRVCGVELADGAVIPCRAVVLTTGTALRGRLHTGTFTREGGGGGSPAARTLSGSLTALGHRLARLKTGTVPRLDGRSIDWDRVLVQDGDHPGGRFSFVGPPSPLPQVRCHVATSSERTHDALRRGLPHSPMYGDGARIDGVGPRYCPSIEDKIVRFPDRTSHRLFLEPEGLASREVYINGFSTSLPVATQLAALRTIEGLEQVRVIRPGYAIEYDFADPRDLDRSLQSRHLPGLWLAGQVNGTTGYEEAAGQGLLAGIAAGRLVLGRSPLLLARDEAYLGVLVDDLITHGTEEPYRMFTSRAEWRLLLREDNADLRLTPRGRAAGLVSDARLKAFEARRDAIERGLAWARTTSVRPGERVQALLEARTGAPLARSAPVAELIRRPELDLGELVDVAGLTPPELGPDELEQVVIQCRYAGYIHRQQAEVLKLRELGGLALPPGIDYARLPGLRHELVEKLSRHRPATLDEAARIPGVTPAALALLAARVRSGGEA